MTTITKAKLALTGVAVVVFGIGVRLDDARYRYAAIALVAIAWALRFVRAKPTPDA
ncbi:MAG: hypothetical protein ACT4R6_09710 [Gemmatimonadaceae bacterium]